MKSSHTHTLRHSTSLYPRHSLPLCPTTATVPLSLCLSAAYHAAGGSPFPQLKPRPMKHPH